MMSPPALEIPEWNEQDEILEQGDFSLMNSKIEESGKLVAVCEHHIRDMKEELLTIPFSPFQSLRNWREKRKEDRIMADFEQLEPKIQEEEASLRSVMIQGVEQKEVIKEQARIYEEHLSSCIRFTEKGLESCEPAVDMLRDIINNITREAYEMKNMVAFNQDIVRQQKMEDKMKKMAMSRMHAFRGRHSRQHTNPNSCWDASMEDCTGDTDHQMLLDRLLDLRKSREDVMVQLSKALETKETLAVNLDNCLRSKAGLDLVFKRGSPEKSNPNQSQQKKRKEAEELDAEWYSLNCHKVYSSVSEMTSRLETLREIVTGANTQLQLLVEARENIASMESAIDSKNSTAQSQSPSSSNNNIGETIPISAGEN